MARLWTGFRISPRRANHEEKDPNTINLLGDHYFHGLYGLRKDLRKGAELWKEAAELALLVLPWSCVWKRGGG